MICSPCLSELHEFCRGDVRDCGCDCAVFFGFADADVDERDPDLDEQADERDAPDDWQIGQDRYERQLYDRD